MTKMSDVAIPSLLITEGTEPSAPAAGKQRLYIDSTTHLLKRTDSSGVDVTLEGGPGTMLGITRYQTGTDTALATTTSATQADVDATNAKVVFTAPASGKVIVRVGIIGGNSNAGANDYFGIRESTTNVVTKQIVHTKDTNAMCIREFYITGISAGSHTYKLAFSTSAGTFSLYTGPTFGDLEMTVWEAV